MLYNMLYSCHASILMPRSQYPVPVQKSVTLILSRKNTILHKTIIYSDYRILNKTLVPDYKKRG